jgi:F-type H+-transporting ATPase subunit gamma
MSIKTIKNKIRAVGKTSQVTKALESVSAVKMRKSQEKALRGRPYATAALGILKRLAGSIDGTAHPLTKKREVKTLGVLVFSSDKGLAGALNSAVLKEATAAIEKRNLPKEKIVIYAIGKKAFEFFSKRGYKIGAHFDDIEDQVEERELLRVTDAIISGFMQNAIDECVIVYTNFKSTFEQKAVSRTVLPITLDSMEEFVSGIVPIRGRYSDVVHADEPPVKVYTVEPDPVAVLSALLPRLANIAIYHALIEARASEHSARMVAMKNASDKAREVTRSLTLVYNKARQALITREVSEIVGGMEAMAN